MDLFYVFSHQIQKWKVYQWMFRITKHKNDKKKKKKRSKTSGYKMDILKSVVILMHPYYPK